MTNRDAFEYWYTETYWDFNKCIGASGNPLVRFDSEINQYSNFDLNLAWNAWNAALDTYKVEA